jgi:hypothetical protein
LAGKKPLLEQKGRRAQKPTVPPVPFPPRCTAQNKLDGIAQKFSQKKGEKKSAAAAPLRERVRTRLLVLQKGGKKLGALS